jgi:predicted RNA-binding protein with PIN domain
MPYLIDGSNVLGVLRLDRHDDNAKRMLIRQLAGFARVKRTRVTCVFDGLQPANFGTHLGAVTVVFSGERSADDVIVQRSETGHGWTVVTADRELANRVKRRQVEIVPALAFTKQLNEAEKGTELVDDWEAYFSNEKNRTKF